MNLFNKGMDWEAEHLSDLKKSNRRAWIITGVLAVLLAISVVSLALLAPMRRTVPYTVMVDKTTGNVEVLQPFDNRQIEMTDLIKKYWASKYVMSREQYNYWLIGADYDFVSRTTAEKAWPEYAEQFSGEQSLDKVFGKDTERRIKILSVVPSPTLSDAFVIRFERTTVTKGAMVEQPTIYSAIVRYAFAPRQFGPERELLINPMGFVVTAYRRDVEQAASPRAQSVPAQTPTRTAPAAVTAAPAVPPAPVATAAPVVPAITASGVAP